MAQAVVKEIDFEIGHLDLWVSFGRAKPFHVHIFREKGEWKFEHHATKLTAVEEQQLEKFVQEMIRDMREQWLLHMSTRLNWSQDVLPSPHKKRK